MTTPTVAVTVTLVAQDGAPYEGVTVRAKLDRNDVYEEGDDGSVVIADQVEAVTDENGVAILNCFPNALAPDGLGTLGTIYTFRANIPGGRALNVQAIVPNEACRLEDILTNVSAAEQEVLAAHTSANEAAASATAAAASAEAAAANQEAAEAAAAEVLAAVPLLNLADYSALRAYSGDETKIYITGYLVSAAPSSIAGNFVRDDGDTTTEDNGGTVIVDADGVRWKRVEGDAVHAAWFAVSASGSDISTALQTAITAAAGKTLVLPAGTLVCDSQLQGLSNVRIVGQGKGKTILDFSGAATGSSGAFQDSAIYCEGTLGSEVAATTSLAAGSGSVTCDAAPGVVAGDWILLKGDTTTAANNCLSSSAGENRLGDDTQEVPFAEIIQVEGVSSNTIDFRGTNYFPYTTKLFVQKITPVENFQLEDLTIRLGSNLWRNRMRLVRGLRVENCSFESTGKMRAVNPEMCWDFEIVHNVFEFAANANTESSLATDYNAVSIINGCAYGKVAFNHIYNPTQGIDVTYIQSASSQGAPNREIDIDDNTVVGSSYHGITTHTGSTNIRIRRNTLDRCETGVLSRCRNGVIEDNEITVTGEGDSSYGIWLGDNGYYIGSSVKRNKIRNADIGIELSGSTTPFKRRDVDVEDNELFNCILGIDAATTGATSEQSNLRIRGNRFFAGSATTQHIEVGTTNNGVIVEDNVGYGAVSTRGMRIGACNSPVMRNNVMVSGGSGITPFSISTGSTSWVFSGNIRIGSNGSASMPPQDNSALVNVNNTLSGSQYIADDGVVAFGLPSNHCMVIVSCFRSAGNGIAFLQASVAGTKIGGHANFAATTGALTGTTGSDGNVTVSIDASNNFYLENRSGNADTFGVFIVASAA